MAETEVTLWNKYTNSLETKPVLTKAATSGFLNALQEIIAVTATGTIDAQSVEKTVKMSAYGFFVSGPLGHGLYKILEQVFKDKVGGLTN
jgi:predicted glycosyl hydrolase (DUF1957 family)